MVVSEFGCDLGTKRSQDVPCTVRPTDVDRPVRHVIWRVGMHHFEYQDNCQNIILCLIFNHFKFENRHTPVHVY